jgi:surface polysaccharide O-acyltransferase-like enzyme
MDESLANAPAQENKEATQIPVNLVRFVAVILVIVLHASIEDYSGLTFATPLQSDTFWLTRTVFDAVSRPAVSLFVLLTGALLLVPSKVNEPIRVFLKKRLTRIGYAFVFWGFIYFAWSNFVNEPLMLQAIYKGILTGPYYHFWFLYLIAGLYLVTPILRVVTSYGEGKIVKYFIVLWFIAVSIVPLIQLSTEIALNKASTDIALNGNVFIIGGWIGYFLLGFYLQRIKLRTPVLLGIMAFGYGMTIALSWVMTNPLNWMGKWYYFSDSLTFNVVLASVALFMLLCKLPSDWPGKSRRLAYRFVEAVSKNSLPIYLCQLIVLESLQMGVLDGLKISQTTLPPMLEIPLISMLTLFITLGIVLAMKKVPGLRTWIG